MFELLLKHYFSVGSVFSLIDIVLIMLLRVSIINIICYFQSVGNMNLFTKLRFNYLI